MALPIQLAHVAPIPLAVVRRRVRQSELSAVVPKCCGLVWNFAKAHQLQAGRHVAVYLNADIQLEVGVEVAGSFAEDGEVVNSATPTGLAASVVHFGPYQRLGTAHAAIREWCQANGYQLLGPNWEIYGHWQRDWNDDPSQIRTDVFYRVSRDPQSEAAPRA